MIKTLFAKPARVAAIALLGIGGCLSAATLAPQTTFTGTITLKNDQFDNYFVYNASDGNGNNLSGIKGAGVSNPFNGEQNFVPAGTYPVTETVNSYISSGVATALGLLSSNGTACQADATTCHVSVAVNQTLFNSAVNTMSWNQIFSGTAESTIATALIGGDQSALSAFLNQYSSDFINFSSNTSTPITGGILTFSNAADGGSLTFDSISAVGGPSGGGPTTSATPEPSSELLLGAGLGLVGLVSRKLRRS